MIDIPNIGQVFSRDLLPQIDNHNEFLDYLKNNGIKYSQRFVDSDKLKSSQMEFDDDKIYALMNKDGQRRIIISNDNYVLDGHHRWLAVHNSENRKLNAFIIDLPILELIRIAKEFVASKKPLFEDMTHKEFLPIMNSFVDYVSKEQGIKTPPKVEVMQPDKGYGSFGGYIPSENKIRIQTVNRHPMDIFRTLAHELVHHHQNENGKILADSGNTGTPIENEANAVAGIHMRNWAKMNPDYFQMTNMVENRAFFVVGVPCSGKDRIINEIKDSLQVSQELNLNNLYERDILTNRLIISCSAEDYERIEEANENLSSFGFYTEMYFVDIPNEISRIRNEEREKRGQRVLNEGIRFKKYVSSKGNLPLFKTLFENKLTVITNDVSKREFGTSSLTKIYREATPGQEIMERKKDKKFVAKEDGIGPTVNVSKLNMNAGSGLGAPNAYTAGIMEWAKRPSTIQRFEKKYGENASKKLDEAVKILMESVARAVKPKSLRKIRESFDKGIMDTMGVAKSGKDMDTELGEDRPEESRKPERPRNPANSRTYKYNKFKKGRFPNAKKE